MIENIRSKPPSTINRPNKKQLNTKAHAVFYLQNYHQSHRQPFPLSPSLKASTREADGCQGGIKAEDSQDRLKQGFVFQNCQRVPALYRMKSPCDSRSFELTSTSCKLPDPHLMGLAKFIVHFISCYTGCILIFIDILVTPNSE